MEIAKALFGQQAVERAQACLLELAAPLVSAQVEAEELKTVIHAHNQRLIHLPGILGVVHHRAKVEKACNEMTQLGLAVPYEVQAALRYWSEYERATV